MTKRMQVFLASTLLLSSGVSMWLNARGGGDAFAGSLGGSLMGSVIGSAMTSNNRSERSSGSGGSSRRIDKVANRIDDLNDKLSAVRSDFGNDLRELKGLIAANQDNVQSLTDRVDGLSNLKKLIAAVQDGINSLEERIQACENSIKKLLAEKKKPKQNPVVERKQERIIETPTQVEQVIDSMDY